MMLKVLNTRGKMINILGEIDPKDYTLEDYLTGARRIQRFAGIARRVTVWDHLNHCYQWGEHIGLNKKTLAVLIFHEAHEPIFGDVIAPVKSYGGLWHVEHIALVNCVNAISECHVNEDQFRGSIIVEIDNLVALAESALFISNTNDWLEQQSKSKKEKILEIMEFIEQDLIPMSPTSLRKIARELIPYLD